MELSFFDPGRYPYAAGGNLVFLCISSIQYGASSRPSGLGLEGTGRSQYASMCAGGCRSDGPGRRMGTANRRNAARRALVAAAEWSTGSNVTGRYDRLAHVCARVETERSPLL